MKEEAIKERKNMLVFRSFEGREELFGLFAQTAQKMLQKQKKQ